MFQAEGQYWKNIGRKGKVKRWKIEGNRIKTAKVGYLKARVDDVRNVVFKTGWVKNELIGQLHNDYHIDEEEYGWRWINSGRFEESDRRIDFYHK